jgi:serpin B
MVDADQFSGDTRLLFLNTGFFKGTWRHRFSRGNTRPMPFHVTLTQSVSVPIMRQTMQAGYMADDEVSALELAYARGGFSMVVLLPARRDGLGELEATLSVEQVGKWLHQIRPVAVDVGLPRFVIRYERPLKAILEAMGIEGSSGTILFMGRVADPHGTSLGKAE